MDQKGARVVADGLRFANEVRLDAREEWLYVAETTGKRISRFRVEADGALTHPEVFGPSTLGDGLIDGIAFDAYGNLWATDFIHSVLPQPGRRTADGALVVLGI